MLRGIFTAILWQHVVAPLVLPSVVKWLTIERWATRSAHVATTAMPQYSESARSVAKRKESGGLPFEWSTSVLGIINGFATMLGVVVVACFSISEEEASPRPPYIEVRKVWW